ncbi:septal ring lytic transglycosylase RlpA family protein [Hymenobacter setariae]|uniref:septal ring lytic transglycosylase RlpA family protein n=1 Tax=Hymenobacter setariae TaxID=2594794 RepID=UPI001F470A61|nr:septal ring lytic transglycosylase RlpA family protein [Hymenobacter setariae]
MLRGRASWYGREHQGKRTSSGERFNRFKFTCAHKSLPFGTRLRVTNVKNGKSVIVRVSDRGPFRHQRIIDLSEVAARPLGIISLGAATVIAQVVPATTPLGPAAAPRNLVALQAADPNPAAPFTTYELSSLPDSTMLAATASATTPSAAASASTTTGSASQFLVQVGIFQEAQNAEAMRARVLSLDPSLTIEIKEEVLAGQQVSRVLISQLDTWLAAETVQRRLQSWGVTGVVRQLPSQAVVASATTPVAAPLN